MTTTTQLYGFGDGLTSAYRDAINTALAGTTIVLRGDDFYADYPAPNDAEDLIKAALADVDLGALAGEYDKS